MTLSMDCNACEKTFSTAVTTHEWTRYTSGSLVQDVWPDRSIDEREIIIANRPGNPFGKFGFYCDECTQEVIAEMDADFDEDDEPVENMGWPQWDGDDD